MTAGPNITVDGDGSTANPYVISGTGGGAVTCDQVRPCLSAGPGVAYDPATGVISARLSTDAGNNATFGGDQGIFVPAAGGATVITADSPCIALDGDGSAGAPITATPVVDPAPANLLACGPNGLLVTGGAALATGCGLSGDGTAAAPLAAAVQEWPYPCDVTTEAGGVYCDANGVLRAEPRGYMVSSNSPTNNQTYPNLAVPAAQDTLIETRTFLITNPDTCRDAYVIVELELDVDFVLPAGAGAAAGMYTDEMVFHRNTGSSAENDFHVQVTKVLAQTPFVLPPGGSNNFGLDIRLGRGSGGATYNRIQTFVRAFLWIL
ncbi:hypothetical protein [Nonomuraea turcica]|uniref:hypothetical protein n=1 Tax=Nonomuraea sp. G32 TaxID=3067274 RepID=UPI00273C339D|nr:hypothetical protein [Nonomuraea sp. G32]MDP4501084.1 hypothetical protein [Nonomuraea sp. G32]